MVRLGDKSRLLVILSICTALWACSGGPKDSTGPFDPPTDPQAPPVDTINPLDGNHELLPPAEIPEAEIPEVILGGMLGTPAAPGADGADGVADGAAPAADGATDEELVLGPTDPGPNTETPETPETAETPLSPPPLPLDCSASSFGASPTSITRAASETELATTVLTWSIGPGVPTQVDITRPGSTPTGTLVTRYMGTGATAGSYYPVPLFDGINTFTLHIYQGSTERCTLQATAEVQVVAGGPDPDPDTDGDGVPDDGDACHDVPAGDLDADGDGCPDPVTPGPTAATGALNMDDTTWANIFKLEVEVGSASFTALLCNGPLYASQLDAQYEAGTAVVSELVQADNLITDSELSDALSSFFDGQLDSLHRIFLTPLLSAAGNFSGTYFLRADQREVRCALIGLGQGAPLSDGQILATAEEDLPPVIFDINEVAERDYARLSGDIRNATHVELQREGCADNTTFADFAVVGPSNPNAFYVSGNETRCDFYGQNPRISIHATSLWGEVVVQKYEYRVRDLKLSLTETPTSTQEDDEIFLQWDILEEFALSGKPGKGGKKGKPNETATYNPETDPFPYRRIMVEVGPDCVWQGNTHYTQETDPETCTGTLADKHRVYARDLGVDAYTGPVLFDVVSVEGWEWDNDCSEFKVYAERPDGTCYGPVKVTSVPTRPDTDGDGVYDDEDDCQWSRGPADNNGCPDTSIAGPDFDVETVTDWPASNCAYAPGPARNLVAFYGTWRMFVPDVTDPVSDVTRVTGKCFIVDRPTDERVSVSFNYPTSASDSEGEFDVDYADADSGMEPWNELNDYQRTIVAAWDHNWPGNGDPINGAVRFRCTFTAENEARGTTEITKTMTCADLGD